MPCFYQTSIIQSKGEKKTTAKKLPLASFSWVQTQILNAAAQPTNPQIYSLYEFLYNFLCSSSISPYPLTSSVGE